MDVAMRYDDIPAWKLGSPKLLHNSNTAMLADLTAHAHSYFTLSIVAGFS